ncbi:MAG: hypothetical protein D6737_06935 [Chloroflexi bacterium]|nr:MAG: hypothetical protein CUN54_00935 [Phototrophicales bacterium]RMF80768.1 MAG: hypothetical protein D6737_06935 [Chloroflexota bacterium]
MTDYPDKIVIFGQYKTGTTALFYKIKQSLPQGRLRTLFEPDRFVPQSNDDAKIILAKVIVGAGGHVQYDAFLDFDKQIYLIRDPRDWLISGLLFILQQAENIYTNHKTTQHVLSLLRQKETDPKSLSVKRLMQEIFWLGYGRTLQEQTEWIVRHHAWLTVFENRLQDAYWLKYESFVDDELEALRTYLGFELQPGTATIEAPAHQHVIRTRTYGNWRNWLVDDDVEYFKPLFQEYLRRHNYEQDWTLNIVQEISPAHCSQYVERIISKRLAQIDEQQ